MFNIKEFQAAFLTLYYTIIKCILDGNSACSMRFHCTNCASKEGCFIRRYRSDPAMYSTVPAPKKEPCTLCSLKKSFKLVFQRYIILFASVFYMGIVRGVCVFIAQNARRKKGVLSEDIAAILLCTALYLHPGCNRILYFQYKRVSSWLFNAILYYK